MRTNEKKTGTLRLNFGWTSLIVWILLATSCSAPFPDGKMFDYVILFRLIPLPSASLLITADGDTNYNTYSGTLTLTPPSDESWIHHYSIYWGNSASDMSSLFTTVNPTGSPISIAIPAGTAFPSGTTHIVVDSGNEFGNRSGVPASIAITDLRQYRIFLSNALHNGDFANDGALTGSNWMEKVDDFCNKDANKPASPANAASASYAALIVDGSLRIACSAGNANCASGTLGQKEWVLKDNTEYLRASDSSTLFTTNVSKIFVFDDAHSIGLANSFDTAGNPWFTGLNPDWTSATDDCSGWFTSAPTGTYGNISVTDSTSLMDGFGGISCGSNNRILCVQQ